MKLAFIDTETTGLDPNVHTPWEVAVIQADTDNKGFWTYQTECRQITLTHRDETLADKQALEVGDWAERYNHGNCAEDPAKVAAWVAEATAGRVLVGSNPAFDEAFLRRLLLQHGHVPQWHYRTVCVTALAAGYLTARGETVEVPWSSRSLSEQLGVTNDNPHTAVGDAAWALGLWHRIMETRPGLVSRTLTSAVADMARSYAEDGLTLEQFADLLSGQDVA